MTVVLGISPLVFIAVAALLMFIVAAYAIGGLLFAAYDALSRKLREARATTQEK